MSGEPFLATLTFVLLAAVLAGALAWLLTRRHGIRGWPALAAFLYVVAHYIFDLVLTEATSIAVGHPSVERAVVGAAALGLVVALSLLFRRLRGSADRVPTARAVHSVRD